jgi:PST family polysaccharide transporter
VTPAWIKILPAPLRAKVEDRPNLQKALTNTGWLFGDKILRMGVGLLVGVWIARYLGPEQFGLMNYAMAIVALFGAVASLGLNGIVVRDLVREPDSANTTLGTAFLMQFIGGFLAFALAIAAIGLARPDDSLAKAIVAVLGFAMVFKSTEVVKYWFESQVKSKHVVWMENGVFLVLAVSKIGLILMEAPLMAFVWAAFAEGALVAVGLLAVYAWRGGALGVWRIRYGRAKALLQDGWPLILSGLAVMVYMRIDQIMLAEMVGDEAVGIYSSALRISEVWYMIPMIITSSLFPAIMEAKRKSEKLFEERMQQLLNLMVIIALSISIVVTFSAERIIDILYGEQYQAAAEVLVIHIWAAVVVFIGVPGNKWYILHNLTKMNLVIAIAGGIVNILLNLVLIPIYAAKGAAIATLLSYTIANFILDISVSRTRPLFFLKAKSILFPLALLGFRERK